MVTTFVNLSGGVDSTYYLWRWLRENPDEEILVHHCLFLQRRLSQEKQACENILSYLKEEGLTNFQFVQTGVQRGTLQGRILDIELLSGIAAVVVKNSPTIQNILLPYSKEETKELNRHYIEHGTIAGYNPTHRYTTVNIVMEALNQKKFNYIMYTDETKGIISKQQMMAEMPRELFDLTWYCRRPVGEDGKCGRCHTCRKVNKAKAELNKLGYGF